MKVSKAWATYLPAGTKQVIAKLQTNSLSSSGILSWDSFMLQRQNNGSDWIGVRLELLIYARQLQKKSSLRGICSVRGLFPGVSTVFIVPLEFRYGLLSLQRVWWTHSAQSWFNSVLIFVLSLSKRKISLKRKLSRCFAFFMSSPKKASFQGKVYVTSVLTAMQNEISCGLAFWWRKAHRWFNHCFRKLHPSRCSDWFGT